MRLIALLGTRSIPRQAARARSAHLYHRHKRPSQRQAPATTHQSGVVEGNQADEYAHRHRVSQLLM